MNYKTINLTSGSGYVCPDAQVSTFRATGLICVSTGIQNLTVNDLSGDVEFEDA